MNRYVRGQIHKFYFRSLESQLSMNLTAMDYDWLLECMQAPRQW